MPENKGISNLGGPLEDINMEPKTPEQAPGVRQPPPPSKTNACSFKTKNTPSLSLNEPLKHNSKKRQLGTSPPSKEATLQKSFFFIDIEILEQQAHTLLQQIQHKLRGQAKVQVSKCMVLLTEAIHGKVSSFSSFPSDFTSSDTIPTSAATSPFPFTAPTAKASYATVAAEGSVLNFQTQWKTQGKPKPILTSTTGNFKSSSRPTVFGPTSSAASVPTSFPSSVPLSAPSFKDNRVVLKIEHEMQDFKPYTLRDQLNKALRDAKITKVVIAAVAKSVSGNSIILTTTQGSDTSILHKQMDLLKLILPVKEVRKDENWVKVLIHGLPTELFDTPNGMELLRSEVETYNQDISLAATPFWLSRREVRGAKEHATAILPFKTQHDADKALKRSIVVAGLFKRTAVYRINKPSDQCPKCQKFGHSQYKCQGTETCGFCGAAHHTDDHNCIICKSKKSCTHIPPKCANCNENHMANNPKCDYFLATKPYYIKQNAATITMLK